MRKLIILLALIPLLSSAQEESQPKSTKKGWAINAGAGIMFGGNIGLQGEYQILLKEKLRLTPFLSAGVSDAGWAPESNKRHYWFGYSAGTIFEYGKKHRIIAGPHYSGNNLIKSSPEVKKNTFGGASFILGYKGVADFGLMWQVYIGNFYSPDDDAFSANTDYEHRSHAGAAIGYKF